MKDNFLSSGVYGCVYHPPYDCQGRPKSDKTEVTKIVKSDFTTRTEYNIGKILKEPGFITISGKCDIEKKDLEKSAMRPHCKLLTKDPKLDKKYLLLYSKYVQSEELSDYLKKHNTISFIMKAYFLLCERIDTLLTHGIVHHDLHFGNILYDNSQLYVIDFGLALIHKMYYMNDKPNYSYLKDAIFKYAPSWNYWTLEYHFLCYLIHEGPLTRPTIEHTIKYYLIQHKIFRLLGKEFIINYKNVATDYFMKYNGVSRDEAVMDLLKTSSTWDFYKIALHFIEIYHTTRLDISAFKTLLLIMVHPIPEYRPTQIEMKQFNQGLINHAIYKNQKTGAITKQLMTRLSSSASAFL
jgi:serine/threonine protein kinase